MNRVIILGGTAALAVALVSVMAVHLTRTPTVTHASASSPAPGTAGDPSPKSAPTGNGVKLVASSLPARSPVPTQAEQGAKRTEPATTQGLAAAQSGPAAFGGTWVLDKARREGLPPGMDQVMTVTPSSDGINTETQVTSPRGVEVVREGYTVNGREVEFASKWAGGVDSKGTRIARLTAEGRGVDITEHATLNAPGGLMAAEITRSWSLSPDGKNLTIKTFFKSPSLIYDNTRLFVRK